MNDECNNEWNMCWIDVAKFIAIMAVLVDHTYEVLYTNKDISIASYFSVSLFILLMGINIYNSNCRHGEAYMGKRLKNILIPYMIATFIYEIVICKSFDLNTYILYLIGFNMSGSFYYVALYIQLVLVSNELFKIIKWMGKYPRNRILLEIVLLVGLMAFSSWTTNNTNILNIYGGGGKLFGGTYLVLFYLGMLIARHRVYDYVPKSRKGISVILIIFLLLWYLWWRFECINSFKLDSMLPFGEGINPPSISSCTMALIMLGLSLCMTRFLECYSNRFVKMILSGFSYIGKNTLYIFLYHRLFLDFILTRICIFNIWVKRIVYLFVLVFGSIGIKLVISYLKRGNEKIRDYNV